MKQNEFRRNIFLTIIGAGIGWLVGLSVSPVVSIVITSVTGSAAAIIAAMSGLEDKSNQSDGNDKLLFRNYRWQVNPLPLALLVVGILFGSTIGILARNQSWFGSDVSIEAHKWTRAGLTGDGYSQDEIVRKLFNRQLSTGTSVTKPVTSGTVLFAVDSEECEALRAAALRTPDEELISALRNSTVKQLRNLPSVVTDYPLLKAIIEEALCANEPG